MIYYFSGTGNSKYITQLIAEKTNDCTYNVATGEKGVRKDNKNFLGFIFPVYGWQPPKIIKRFCEKINASIAKERFVYVIMTCGDDAGKAFDIFRKKIGKSGLTIDSSYTVIMPNTYVCLPGFDVDSIDIRKDKYKNAISRISRIATNINAKERHKEINEGIFPYTKTYILGNLFYRILVTDHPFKANEKCIKCGICSKACPVQNITMLEGIPKWHGNCEGCLNCYHSCPQHAINYGKQTLRKGQYTFKRYANEAKEFIINLKK